MGSVGSDRLPPLTPEVLDEDQATLREAIVGGDRGKQPQHFPLTDDDGSLHGPFGIMLTAPALGDALQQLGATIRFRTDLSARIREIAILQTAHATGSSFEWWAHARVGRAVGLTDEEIMQLSIGCFASEDPTESAVAGLCQGLLTSGVITDEDFDAARAHLSHRQITEVTTLVGYYRLLAELMRIYDVGVPGDDPSTHVHHCSGHTHHREAS